MIGFLKPDRGSAFIAGKNIETEGDDVYACTGVCPQDNYLWETLTAREHLNFYGRLKRLSGSELSAAVDAALAQVSLQDVANKRTGKFSGGARFTVCLVAHEDSLCNGSGRTGPEAWCKWSCTGAKWSDGRLLEHVQA